MAWLFVPGSEDSISASRSLVPDIEQSVTSRGRLMRRPYWLSAWKKGSWIRLLSGMILPRSEADAGVAEWISSMLAYHASPTPSPDESKATKTTDISGPTSSESSRKPSPPWCSSKTSQDSLPGFDLSERNYQLWASTLRRDSLARRKSGQAINGSGSSSWLTANVPNGGRVGSLELVESRGSMPEGKRSVGLESQSAHWATPKARQRDDSPSERRRNTPSLDSEVLWRTPAKLEAGVKVERLEGKMGARMYDKGTGRQAQYGLTQQVFLQAQETEKPGRQSSNSGPNSLRLWPTARTCEAMARTINENAKFPNLETVVAREGNHGKKINPLFVEWLMGYPLGWTALEPVEMESYLLRQRGLLRALREGWD